MVCPSQIQQVTLDISYNQQPCPKMLHPMDERQGKKKGQSVSRWIMDENSKLYCQWFFE